MRNIHSAKPPDGSPFAIRLIASAAAATVLSLPGAGCALLGVGGAPAPSSHRARAYALNERPAEDGSVEVRLFAVEFEGALPGDAPRPGAGVELVPASAFPTGEAADAASGRRSAWLLPGEGGQLVRQPLDNADLAFYIASDSDAMELGLLALTEVAALADKAAPSARANAPGSPPLGLAPLDIDPLLADSLLDALRARRATERALAAARARAEALASVADSLRGRVASSESALASLIARAEAAADAGDANRARSLGREASATQLALRDDRDRLAQAEAAASEADADANRLAETLAEDDSLQRLADALASVRHMERDSQ